MVASHAAPAATLLLWTADAGKEEVAAWAARAPQSSEWTVKTSETLEPEIKRALATGRLSLALMHPHDSVDLALLGKTFGAEWVMLPGKKATLVSVDHLQAALLTLGDSEDKDRKQMEDSIVSIASHEPSASQYEALAARWLTLGQSDSALQTLEGVQAKEPGRVSTIVLTAQAYRLKGDLRESRRLLRMGLKQHPDDSKLLRASGEIELAGGDAEAALDFYNRDMASHSEDASLHRLMGDAYLSEGRYRQAEESYRQAGNDPAVQVPLARLMARRGNWAEAGERASRAVEQNPNDWEMRFIAVKSLSQNRRYAEAAHDRATLLSTMAESELPSSSVSLLETAVRDQVADLINGIRRLQLENADSPLLYSAAQESVIAADRLSAALRGRPDWEEGSLSGRQRLLALSLWSEGSFDLVKALEAKDLAGLNDPGDLLHDALRQLDEARHQERRTSLAEQLR